VIETPEPGRPIPPDDLMGTHWSFKCRLRGGVQRVYRVWKEEHDRLWDVVQRTDAVKGRFVVFDAVDPAIRIVLNLDHVLYSHFLLDPARHVVVRAPGESDDVDGVRVLFAGEVTFHQFHVAPDEVNEDDEQGELAALVLEAEEVTEDDEAAMLSFTDVDDETVWLRAADVAVIEIPLWAVDPANHSLPDDGADEG
jgi:hypothetical protein